MDMDPGEGTSDGRVKREPNSIEVEIKQEPNIKEEPTDGSEFGLVTRLSEGFGADTTAATLNIGLVDMSKSDFDLNGVKEEVKSKGEKPRKGKDSSPNSVSNGNETNARVGQNDEPTVQINVSRKRLISSSKGKKCDGSKKQNKQKIPRNKAAKKRTEHKCHVCGYVTSKKGNLTRHIRIHTGDKQFECSVCFKSFAQKNYLNVHLRTHADDLPHSCLKCGQRFSSDEARQSHEKRCKHRRYECYLCEYKCFGKSQLKRHMQAKHTGDRQFQCEICGKKFIHRGDLNQHLAIHRDQFPFRCIKCHRGFTKEEDKTAHEKICARRQYRCYICEFSTLKSAKLRYHMRAHHTGEKPFHCKWCKARFSHKSNANTHMKRRHRLMK